MSRNLSVAVAQMGPVQPTDDRHQVVQRLVSMLERAAAKGCRLIAFPELALTPFFARMILETEAERDYFFQFSMPDALTQPLFDAARECGCGFYLGYAEAEVIDGIKTCYNSAILVDETGSIVGKYRKIHLPGNKEPVPGLAWQNLEKRYFSVGDLGFPVFRAFGGIIGMALCNDRRWPETFRVMGLQGVELVLVGYNTPVGNARSAEQSGEVRSLQNTLSLQAGAYQNSAFVCGIAKAGIEDGCHMMGGSCIVAPNGMVIAKARTLQDELIYSDIDLDETAFLKKTVFNFEAHRRVEHYGRITAQTGVILPPEQQ